MSDSTELTAGDALTFASHRRWQSISWVPPDTCVYRKDAAFLLTIGSFLPTVELFYFTVDDFSFFAYTWSFFAYGFSFFTYSWSFFAHNGKVRLISALRDCKPRSLTVSEKAPTVSKKASPVFTPCVFRH